MLPARIAELLHPYVGELDETRLKYISTYIDVLLRWNARINLTAIRDPEQIVTRHFGESLFAARHLFAQTDATDLIDLGSGAGFPGLPMKIWAPKLQVTLIESNQKKATFLREMIRTITLTDINVVSTRAEAFSGRAATVTLRAVERFESILPVAASLTAPAGRLALLIGESQIAQATTLLSAWHWSEPIPTPGSANRVLLVAKNEPA